MTIQPPSRPWPKHRHVLPGFGLTLGLTLAYVGFLVLLPLTALFAKATGAGWQSLIVELTAPRTLAAFRVTFGLSALAALLNGALGLLLAWALVRYDFPGRKLMDAIVDLPFALPTAVAGITLASLYSNGGWLGALLLPLGIEVAFKPAGIFVALVFIGLPFVVRTLQPLLADLDQGMEEAAWTLGASSRQTFWRIILPPLLPGLLTGMALAFARAVGEYGSVIFIAGNMPGLSEILPLLIVIKLEQYNDAGAALIACSMLVASFMILLTINLIERWTRRSHGG